MERKSGEPSSQVVSPPLSPSGDVVLREADSDDRINVVEVGTTEPKRCANEGIASARLAILLLLLTPCPPSHACPSLWRFRRPCNSCHLVQPPRYVQPASPRSTASCLGVLKRAECGGACSLTPYSHSCSPSLHSVRVCAAQRGQHKALGRSVSPALLHSSPS